MPVASAESIDLGSGLAPPEGDRAHGLLRKEVIQPQVLLQLPCYDFTPITSHSVGACLLAVSAATSRATAARASGCGSPAQRRAPLARGSPRTVRGKGTSLSQPLLPFCILRRLLNHRHAVKPHGDSVRRGGCKARGYSSVARAVALQAIGLGFKSPYLQCHGLP